MATAIHQWTNGGDEVLILRFVDREHRSYGGFQHPSVVGETVIAPDWNTKAECGGGIHGWPWGMSLGEGKEVDWNALWQVYGVKPVEIVEISGKIKFREGALRFIGDWHAAMLFVLSGQMAWVHESARGAASATGESGAASATGESGAASATGGRGAASATGHCSAAVVTNIAGKARAGKFGCIALAWWNDKDNRAEMRCAPVGQGVNSLKENTWYGLNKSGNFVEVEDEIA